jgi:hypothetical protein
MVKELVPQIWCDIHLKEGEKIPGIHSIAFLVNGCRYDLDLCEDHAKDIIAFAKLGVRRGGKQRKVR